MVIIGDDVGIWNVGANSHGMLGRFDPEFHEWVYVVRKLLAENLWTLVFAQAIMTEHIRSLQEFLPRRVQSS